MDTYPEVEAKAEEFTEDKPKSMVIREWKAILSNRIKHFPDIFPQEFIAEIDEIPEPIAAAELDGNIKKLSRDGAFTKEWVQRSLDMATLIGMKNLAPADKIYIDTFKPVPTKA